MSPPTLPFRLGHWLGSVAMLCLAFGPLSSGLQAGQLYGSLTSAGKPVPSAPLTISCAGAETKGSTGADGTYRINVTPQGRCTLTLSGYAGNPSVVVFSYDKPTLYDLEVVRRPDGTFELRIR